MSLTNLSTLQVIAGFSETDAAKIQLGQPATVTFNALPNQTLAAKVTQININSVTVSNVITYNVTVSITGAPSSLKPGMTANLSVVTQEKDNVVELPSSAITASGNTAVVQVLQRDGKSVPTTITIGMRGDTNDEITSGLKAGDKVVVSLGSRAGSSLSSTGRGGFAGLGGGPGGGVAIRVGGGG
jgi:multidrug efflux pump subunit AcrA (membrane-fusion protein)